MKYVCIKGNIAELKVKWLDYIYLYMFPSINKVLWFRPMVVDQVISQRHDMNRNDFAPQLVYCHSNVNNDLWSSHMVMQTHVQHSKNKVWLQWICDSNACILIKQSNMTRPETMSTWLAFAPTQMSRYWIPLGAMRASWYWGQGKPVVQQVSSKMARAVATNKMGCMLLVLLFYFIVHTRNLQGLWPFDP